MGRSPTEYRWASKQTNIAKFSKRSRGIDSKVLSALDYRMSSGIYRIISGYLRPDIGNADPLRSAEENLRAVLGDHDAKPYVVLESHLLLAKLHYLCADFEQAVADVDNSKLERNDIQFQTLRTLRLVAEAYAIKGSLLIVRASFF